MAEEMVNERTKQLQLQFDSQAQEQIDKIVEQRLSLMKSELEQKSLSHTKQPRPDPEPQKHRNSL